jgi:acetyl esterase/lipase
VLAALAAVLTVAPILTRGMWIARLALRETSLIISAVGVLAFRLADPERRPGRIARWLAGPAIVVGLLPFGAQWLTMRRLGLPFSMVEYATGLRPPAVREEHDLVLETGPPPLAADVYHGLGGGARPFVVAVHGGSWRGGERGQGRHTWRALAAAGYTVVDVDYRLAPAHPFPEAVGDVKCLLGRVRQRATALSIDPRRAALVGRSAGGQLVLVAGYSTGDPRLPPSCATEDAPVQAVIALYAPADLAYGYYNPMRPDVLQSTRALEAYLGGSPRQRRDAYLLANPRTWVRDAPLPPTLLLSGRSDPIVECLHSQLLAAELQAAGQRVLQACVPFGEHGFDARPGSVSEQLTRQAMLRWLKAI